MKWFLAMVLALVAGQAAAILPPTVGEIHCNDGKAVLSFRTPAPRVSTPGLVWIGAVSRYDETVGYTLQDDTWVAAGGSAQAAPWRIYGAGLRGDDVAVVALYSGNDGSSKARRSELLSFRYGVGWGVLTQEAQDRVQRAQEAAARAIEGPRPNNPVLETPEKDQQAYAEDPLVARARGETSTWRQGRTGGVCTGQSGDAAAACQAGVAQTQSALANPSSVPRAGSIDVTAALRGQIGDNMRENETVSEIVLTFPDDDDAYSSCIED